MSIEWFCKVVSKKFIPIKKLGSGSFASVWMAYDLDENKYVAIKIYYSKEFKNGEDEAKIFKELCKNNNSNILKFIGTYMHKENNKKYCINSFELMMNSTQSLLKLDTFHTYGLPYDHVIKLFKQILEGVAYLHENGYLHGDIKPENILICGLSEECKDIITKLKLPDFAKKRKRSGVADQMTEYIRKNIEYEETDSDVESEDSDSDSEDEENNHQVNEDDKLSIFSDDDFNDKSDNTEHIPYVDTDKIKKEYLFLSEKCNNVKLGDMGSTIKIDKINYNKKHIQTSYYRPPEIILRTKFNEKIDIWALGCMLYEYLTGDILFDPDEYDKIHFIRYHLFMINETVGSIPLKIINQSTNKDILFMNETSCVKGDYAFDIERNIINKLKNKLNNKNLQPTEFNLLVDVFLKMLNCDYEKRISIKELLNHDIFKNK